MQRLQGKVAIVSGASSGIGRATALALAREGARVAVIARREDELRRTAGEITGFGSEAQVCPANVTDPEQVGRAVAECLSRWGRVDIAVANAGAYVRARVIHATAEVFERSFAVNFYGALHLMRAVLPTMLAQRSGHLVFVSSMDAKKGLPLDAPYVAAKAAMAGLGEVARQELRQHGIFVTTVFPGRVDTPLIGSLKVPAISAKIPAEQVARAIVRAILRRQPEVIVPPHVRLLLYLNTFSPCLGDWVVRLFHLEGWGMEPDPLTDIYRS